MGMAGSDHRRDGITGETGSPKERHHQRSGITGEAGGGRPDWGETSTGHTDDLHSAAFRPGANPVLTVGRGLT